VSLVVESALIRNNLNSEALN